MSCTSLILIAPKVMTSEHSEAEVFGSVVWLWMHSKYQSDMPLSALSSWLLPALHFKQYVLAYETDGQHLKPVAYAAWAQLSAEAESRYVNSPTSGLSERDWCTGDRFWITDFFAPYGHAKPFAKAAAANFPDLCFRSLHHRGADRGMRILHFRGDHVSVDQAKHWWRSRPILAYQSNELTNEGLWTSS